MSVRVGALGYGTRWQDQMEEEVRVFVWIEKDVMVLGWMDTFGYEGEESWGGGGEDVDVNMERKKCRRG